MSMGMTYEEFWYGDVDIAPAVRKSWEYKKEDENLSAWLQGRYFYDALCEASPLFRFSFKNRRIEPKPYTAEPYPVTKADREAREERKKKQEMERLKMAFMEFASHVKPRTQNAVEHRSVEQAEDTDGNDNRPVRDKNHQQRGQRTGAHQESEQGDQLSLSWEEGEQGG